MSVFLHTVSFWKGTQNAGVPPRWFLSSKNGWKEREADNGSDKVRGQSTGMTLISCVKFLIVKGLLCHVDLVGGII